MVNLNPEEYVVYSGYGEPVGLMKYGGRFYYSDEPPWLTPESLASGLYRKKGPRASYRLVPVDNVSDDTYEKALRNQRSGRYSKHRLLGGLSDSELEKVREKERKIGR